MLHMGWQINKRMAIISFPAAAATTTTLTTILTTSITTTTSYGLSLHRLNPHTSIPIPSIPGCQQQYVVSYG